MLKQFEVVESKGMLPVVPVFNFSNKPTVQWKREDTWITTKEQLINQSETYKHLYIGKDKKTKEEIREYRQDQITGTAVLTGECSGIIAIDLDRNHGSGEADGVTFFKNIIDSLEFTDEEKSQITDTFMVKTPRGGLHLYFKYRKGLSSTSLKQWVVDEKGEIILRPNKRNPGKMEKWEESIGIDIRSDGGCIIAPGTIRKVNGEHREYEVYKDAEIKHMPAKLFDELLAYSNKARTTTKDGKKGVLKSKGSSNNGSSKKFQNMKKDFYSVTSEGSRDETLYKYICSLIGKGITDYSELEGMAIAYNSTYIDPPLEHQIVLNKIDSAVKHVNESKEKLKDSIIGQKDPKRAFLEYMNGNLRALINSDDDNKFAYWNEIAWNCLNTEEVELLYGDFCKYAQSEASALRDFLPPKDFDKLENKILGWDKSNKAAECFNSIRRDRDYVINMKETPNKLHFMCTSNGFIIDFLQYEIREAKKDDYILNTLKYNLVDKEKSIDFMERNIFPLLQFSLGSREKLEFLNKFVATKLMGRRVQGAIFNFGAAASGKSFFKKLLLDLLGNRCYDLNYAYLTTKHQGNSDTSRDDKLVGLHDKLLFVSSEPDDTDVLVMGKFKLILSGDSSLNARPTNGKEQQIDLSRLDGLIDLNGFPQFTGYDAAIERRLYGVNWENSIPHEQRDPNYYDNNVTPNFNYVFSYYVHLAMEICRDDFKLDNIDVLMKDTKMIREEADSLTSFFNNCIVRDSESVYILDDLYNNYMSYIKTEELEYSLPQSTADKPKAAKLFIKKRIEESIDFKGVEYGQDKRTRLRGFIGLGIKPRFTPVENTEKIF